MLFDTIFIEEKLDGELVRRSRYGFALYKSNSPPCFFFRYDASPEDAFVLVATCKGKSFYFTEGMSFRLFDELELDAIKNEQKTKG